MVELPEYAGTKARVRHAGGILSSMVDFYPFFLILFAGVFFSIAVRRLHVPWVVSLIVAGIVAGPHMLDVLTVTPTIEFLGQLGLVFLMFMAGLETKVASFKTFKTGLVWLSFINGAVPFLVGFGIGLLFGYSMLSSIVLGVIFISSSIAVVIPSLEKFRLLHTRLGQSVVATTVIQDIVSLIILSILLQNIQPIPSLPVYIFIPLVLALLLIMKVVVPKILWFLTWSMRSTPDMFQQSFRSTFLVLLGTVILFDLLGLHPIIAGFFAGLVLAETITSDGLRDKIRTISYGVFVPTFFVVIGAQTDVASLVRSGDVLLLAVVVILGSVLSKLASGWAGGRMVGFSSDQSLLFAITSVPQLSTTLAVTFTALSLGLLDQALATALVVLSVVTVIVSPILMNILGARIQRTIKN